MYNPALSVSLSTSSRDHDADGPWVDGSVPSNGVYFVPCASDERPRLPGDTRDHRPEHSAGLQVSDDVRAAPTRRHADMPAVADEESSAIVERAATRAAVAAAEAAAAASAAARSVAGVVEAPYTTAIVARVVERPREGLLSVPEVSQVTEALLLPHNSIGSAAEGMTAVLPRLTELDLSHNRLITVAGLAAHVPVLHTLDLADNFINDSQLPALAELRHLQRLDLQRNSLTNLGRIGYHLTALTTLNLSHNQITDVSGLGGMAQLRSLDVSGNRLRAIEMGDSGALPQLETVIANDNQLTHVYGLRQDVCPSLTALDVDGNRLTFWDEWPHLQMLRRLSARRNSISGGSSSGIAADGASYAYHRGGDSIAVDGSDTDVVLLPFLEVCLLDHNSVRALAPLQGCRALRHLSAGDNHLESIPDLPGLDMLVTLDVRRNGITDTSGLATLPSLCTVVLADNAISNVHQLLASITALRSLSVLDCRGNPLTAGFYSELAPATLPTDQLLSASLAATVGIPESYDARNRSPRSGRVRAAVAKTGLAAGQALAAELCDLATLDAKYPLHDVKRAGERLGYRSLLISSLCPSLIALDGVQISGSERRNAFHVAAGLLGAHATVSAADERARLASSEFVAPSVAVQDADLAAGVAAIEHRDTFYQGDDRRKHSPARRAQLALLALERSSVVRQTASQPKARRDAETDGRATHGLPAQTTAESAGHAIEESTMPPKLELRDLEDASEELDVSRFIGAPSADETGWSARNRSGTTDLVDGVRRRDSSPDRSGVQVSRVPARDVALTRRKGLRVQWGQDGRQYLVPPGDVESDRGNSLVEASGVRLRHSAREQAGKQRIISAAKSPTRPLTPTRQRSHRDGRITLTEYDHMPKGSSLRSAVIRSAASLPTESATRVLFGQREVSRSGSRSQHRAAERGSARHRPQSKRSSTPGSRSGRSGATPRGSLIAMQRFSAEHRQQSEAPSAAAGFVERSSSAEAAGTRAHGPHQTPPVGNHGRQIRHTSRVSAIVGKPAPDGGVTGEEDASSGLASASLTHRSPELKSASLRASTASPKERRFPVPHQRERRAYLRRQSGQLAGGLPLQSTRIVKGTLRPRQRTSLKARVQTRTGAVSARTQRARQWPVTVAVPSGAPPSRTTTTRRQATTSPPSSIPRVKEARASPTVTVRKPGDDGTWEHGLRPSIERSVAPIEALVSSGSRRRRVAADTDSPHTESPAASPVLAAPPLGRSRSESTELRRQWDAETDVILRLVFAQLDANGDGRVSRIELIKACRKHRSIAGFLGLPSQIRQEDGGREAVERFFQALDADESNTVEWGEFRRFFHSRAGFVAERTPDTPAGEQDPSDVFARRHRPTIGSTDPISSPTSADGDGAESRRRAHLRVLFDAIDSDADGRITYEELKRACYRNEHVTRYFYALVNPSEGGGAVAPHGTLDVESLFHSMDGDAESCVTWKSFSSFFEQRMASKVNPTVTQATEADASATTRKDAASTPDEVDVRRSRCDAPPSIESPGVRAVGVEDHTRRPQREAPASIEASMVAAVGGKADIGRSRRDVRGSIESPSVPAVAAVSPPQARSTAKGVSDGDTKRSVMHEETMRVSLPDNTPLGLLPPPPTVSPAMVPPPVRGSWYDTPLLHGVSGRNVAWEADTEGVGDLRESELPLCRIYVWCRQGDHVGRWQLRQDFMLSKTPPTSAQEARRRVTGMWLWCRDADDDTSGPARFRWVERVPEADPGVPLEQRGWIWASLNGEPARWVWDVPQSAHDTYRAPQTTPHQSNPPATDRGWQSGVFRAHAQLDGSGAQRAFIDMAAEDEAAHDAAEHAARKGYAKAALAHMDDGLQHSATVLNARGRQERAVRFALPQRSLAVEVPSVLAGAAVAAQAQINATTEAVQARREHAMADLRRMSDPGEAVHPARRSLRPGGHRRYRSQDANFAEGSDRTGTSLSGAESELHTPLRSSRLVHAASTTDRVQRTSRVRRVRDVGCGPGPNVFDIGEEQLSESLPAHVEHRSVASQRGPSNVHFATGSPLSDGQTDPAVEATDARGRDTIASVPQSEASPNENIRSMRSGVPAPTIALSGGGGSSISVLGAECSTRPRGEAEESNGAVTGVKPAADSLRPEPERQRLSGTDGAASAAALSSHIRPAATTHCSSRSAVSEARGPDRRSQSADPELRIGDDDAASSQHSTVWTVRSAADLLEPSDGLADLPIKLPIEGDPDVTLAPASPGSDSAELNGQAPAPNGATEASERDCVIVPAVEDRTGTLGDRSVAGIVAAASTSQGDAVPPAASGSGGERDLTTQEWRESSDGTSVPSELTRERSASGSANTTRVAPSVQSQKRVADGANSESETGCEIEGSGSGGPFTSDESDGTVQPVGVPSRDIGEAVDSGNWSADCGGRTDPEAVLSDSSAHARRSVAVLSKRETPTRPRRTRRSKRGRVRRASGSSGWVDAGAWSMASVDSAKDAPTGHAEQPTPSAVKSDQRQIKASKPARRKLRRSRSSPRRARSHRGPSRTTAAGSPSTRRTATSRRRSKSKHAKLSHSESAAPLQAATAGDSAVRGETTATVIAPTLRRSTNVARRTDDVKLSPTAAGSVDPGPRERHEPTSIADLEWNEVGQTSRSDDPRIAHSSVPLSFSYSQSPCEAMKLQRPASDPGEIDAARHGRVAVEELRIAKARLAATLAATASSRLKGDTERDVARSAIARARDEVIEATKASERLVLAAGARSILGSAREEHHRASRAHLGQSTLTDGGVAQVDTVSPDTSSFSRLPTRAEWQGRASRVPMQAHLSPSVGPAVDLDDTRSRLSSSLHDLAGSRSSKGVASTTSQGGKGAEVDIDLRDSEQILQRSLRYFLPEDLASELVDEAFRGDESKRLRASELATLPAVEDALSRAADSAVRDDASGLVAPYSKSVSLAASRASVGSSTASVLSSLLRQRRSAIIGQIHDLAERPVSLSRVDDSVPSVVPLRREDHEFSAVSDLLTLQNDAEFPVNYKALRIAKCYHPHLASRLRAAPRNYALMWMGGLPEELSEAAVAGVRSKSLGSNVFSSHIGIADSFYRDWKLRTHVMGGSDLAVPRSELLDVDGKRVWPALEPIQSSVPGRYVWRALVCLVCLGECRSVSSGELSATPAVTLSTQTLRAIDPSAWQLGLTCSGADETVGAIRSAFVAARAALNVDSVRICAGADYSRSTTGCERPVEPLGAHSPDAATTTAEAECPRLSFFAVNDEDAWRVVPCYLVEYTAELPL